MPIYRFSESGTFSVLVEVRAENEEEARELIGDGEGEEIESSLQYYDPYSELQEVIDESPILIIDSCDHPVGVMVENKDETRKQPPT